MSVPGTISPPVAEKTERIPLSPPRIAPLVDDVARPMWTVMIPVYNNITFLEETLKSVLQQALPVDEMQIEVIDDASTDGNVQELVERIGNGRVIYFRQPYNKGSLRNFETCINRAKGEMIHILHADDIVSNGFYKTLGELILKHPEAGAVFCRFAYIDDQGTPISQQSKETDVPGILPGWLDKIADHNRIQFAAIAVKRKVYEQIGSYYALTYGEDWEMWVRIARHYPVAYTPEVLAGYRKHIQSITGFKIRTGEYIDDLVKAMQMIQHHLPDEKKNNVLHSSKKYYARYAFNIAYSIWQNLGIKKFAIASIKKALQLDKSFRTCYLCAKLYTRILLNIR